MRRPRTKKHDMIMMTPMSQSVVGKWMLSLLSTTISSGPALANGSCLPCDNKAGCVCYYGEACVMVNNR